MTDLLKMLDNISDELNEFERVRERCIHLSRKLNRLSGRGIALLVRGETVYELMAEAGKVMSEIADGMASLSHLTSWSLVSSGVEEYAEFRIVHALIHGEPLPSPVEIRVPSWLWITALGDAVGELRRYVLKQLLSGDAVEGKKFLGIMEEIYTAIAGMEFSKGVSGTMRHKVDVARSLVERTTSDVLHSMQREV